VSSSSSSSTTTTRRRLSESIETILWVTLQASLRRRLLECATELYEVYCSGRLDAAMQLGDSPWTVGRVRLRADFNVCGTWRLPGSACNYTASVNCIKCLQVHGLGQNFSVNASLLYGINCLSPLIFATITRLKGIILNSDFSDYLVCF